MKSTIESGPITIRVMYADLVTKKIEEFCGGDDTYEIISYPANGNTVYDCVCDDVVEFRVILIGGK